MLSERFKPNVTEQVMRQCNDNKVWRESDTPPRIEQYALGEGQELELEIETHGDIAFLVAGEIGDILYLALKYEAMTGELSPAIQTLVDRAFEICELTGLDPEHCIIMKLLRNDYKYVPYIQNNGFTYAQAVRLSKEIYKNKLHGDEWFSDLWLEHGEEITHTVEV
jgi:hypothetical protein